MQHRECLHPGASPTACSTPITRAHTVSRSRDLSEIARDGHVYYFKANFLTPSPTDMGPTLTGVNEASTFRGFCNAHDGPTFAEIDGSFSEVNSERAFLFAYRVLCRELHAKRGVAALMREMRDGDRGRSRSEQLQIQTFVADFSAGIELGLADLERDKQRMDQILTSRDYSEFKYVVYEADAVAPVLCSGVATVEYDFGGALLQDLRVHDVPTTTIFFSSTANNDVGLFTFGWFRDDAAPQRLMDSLQHVSAEELSDRLLVFLFVSSDNLCIGPEWWDGLTRVQRQFLLTKMAIGLDPLSPVEADGLSAGGPKIATWAMRVTSSDLPRTSIAPASP